MDESKHRDDYDDCGDNHDDDDYDDDEDDHEDIMHVIEGTPSPPPPLPQLVSSSVSEAMEHKSSRNIINTTNRAVAIIAIPLTSSQSSPLPLTYPPGLSPNPSYGIPSMSMSMYPSAQQQPPLNFFSGNHMIGMAQGSKTMSDPNTATFYQGSQHAMMQCHLNPAAVASTPAPISAPHHHDQYSLHHLCRRYHHHQSSLL
jgi:hypothetical protein